MRQKKLVLLTKGSKSSERCLRRMKSEFDYGLIEFDGDDLSNDDFSIRIGRSRISSRELDRYEVVGVVNESEAKVLLAGRLVDRFGVPGSSYAGVRQCKDKAELDLLMRRQGMGQYRPKTQIVSLQDLEKMVLAEDLPIVVKPYSGAKSRGVFVVRDNADLPMIMRYLTKYFKQIQGELSESKMLVEEFIDGQQLTVTAFVDHRGKMVVVSFVDVLTGKDVGEAHAQLVYRCVPSRQPESLVSRVEDMLQKLVSLVGLKSVLIHPEFIVRDKQIFLIELNVRVGGFRKRMMEYAMGIDLDQMVVDMALGKEIPNEFETKKSCTAVEVWDERRGVIRELVPYDDERVVGLRLMFSIGDKYIGPPRANKPLAHFFVVDERDSLAVAKEIRGKWRVEIE